MQATILQPIAEMTDRRPDWPETPLKQTQNGAKTARNDTFPSCRLFEDGEGVTDPNHIFERWERSKTRTTHELREPSPLSREFLERNRFDFSVDP